MATSDDFDYINYIGDSYSQIRRYAPLFLDSFKFTSAPIAKELLDAINILKTLNHENTKEIPENAPTDFIRKRWENLVISDG